MMLISWQYHGHDADQWLLYKWYSEYSKDLVWWAHVSVCASYLLASFYHATKLANWKISWYSNI